MCYAHHLTNICLVLTKLYGMVTECESIANANPYHPFFLFSSFLLLWLDISTRLQFFSAFLPHMFVSLELVVVVMFEMIHVVAVCQGFVKVAMGGSVVVFDVLVEEGRW